MKKNKKVLIINTVGYIYDGITSVILSYLEAMNLEKLDIYIGITIKIEEAFKKKLIELGCNLVYLPNRKRDTLRYVLSLIKVIKDNEIDVIHAHGNSGTLAIEMFAAWIGGCHKRIAHSHNTKCDSIKLDRILRPVLYMLYTKGLACGEDAGRWLFGKRKFTVLTNGRDMEKYKFDSEIRRQLRNKFNIEETTIVVGHVGGFFEQKNHEFLVSVCKEINKINPESVFFMIGDGPLKCEIEKECNDINVIFPGAVDDVENYLQMMDGMLLPSLFEGVPLVAVEWQINGLPCILSDTITKECALVNDIAFLKTDSAKNWAVKILQMIKTGNRSKMSVEAVKTIAKSRYNINNGARLLQKIYEE